MRKSQLTVLSMYYRWLIRVIDGVTCRYEGHAGRLIYTVDNAPEKLQNVQHASVKTVAHTVAVDTMSLVTLAYIDSWKLIL